MSSDWPYCPLISHNVLWFVIISSDWSLCPLNGYNVLRLVIMTSVIILQGCLQYIPWWPCGYHRRIPYPDNSLQIWGERLCEWHAQTEQRKKGSWLYIIPVWRPASETNKTMSHMNTNDPILRCCWSRVAMLVSTDLTLQSSSDLALTGRRSPPPGCPDQ